MLEFLHIGGVLCDAAIKCLPKAQGIKPMRWILPCPDQIIHGLFVSPFRRDPVLKWLSHSHRDCSLGASRWLSSHRSGLGLLLPRSFLRLLHCWGWNWCCVGLPCRLGFFGGCCRCPLCLFHRFGVRLLLLLLGSNWNNRGWCCGSIPITKQTTGLQVISWNIFCWFRGFLGLARLNIVKPLLSYPATSPATPPPFSILRVLFLLCSKAKLLPSSQNLGCGRNHFMVGSKNHNCFIKRIM